MVAKIHKIVTIILIYMVEVQPFDDKITFVELYNDNVGN